MYKSLLKPIVVAMEVMSPVARYLTFIVGADLLSKFQCNETAVSNMRCLKCVYNAKVAYVNLVMYCGAWFI